MDILHHDDGVVDENTDRKDQRKQRHPVERESPGPGCEQRQRQRYHDCNADNHRLASAQRHHDQQHHNRRRKHQFLYQGQSLFIRGSTVVARHGHFDPVGNHDTAQLFDTSDDLVGHLDGIAARFLGDRQRHRRKSARCRYALVGSRGTAAEPDVLIGL